MPNGDQFKITDLDAFAKGFSNYLDENPLDPFMPIPSEPSSTLPAWYIDPDALAEKVNRQALARTQNLDIDPNAPLTPAQKRRQQIEAFLEPHHLQMKKSPAVRFDEWWADFKEHQDFDTWTYNLIKEANTPATNAYLTRESQGLTKKKKISNKLRYGAAKMTTGVPGIGPTIGEKLLNLSKYEPSPMQKQMLRDPLSSQYESIYRGLPFLGTRLGPDEVLDLGLMLMRFKGFGIPLPGGKAIGMPGIEHISGHLLKKIPAKQGRQYLSMMTKRTGRFAPTLINAQRASLNFSIDGLSMLFPDPEFSKEGMELEDKINSTLGTLGHSIFTGSLFSYFGGARGVIKQLGGVFTAGYVSAMAGGEDQHEAIKSGTMLTLLHFVNLQGKKNGTKSFKKWAKENDVPENMIDELAETIVSKTMPKNQERRSPSPEKFPQLTPDPSTGNAHVEVVKKTPKLVIVNDLVSGKKGLRLPRSEFYKHFSESRSPLEEEQLQSRRIQRVQTLVKEIPSKKEPGKNIVNTEEEMTLKRKLMGVEDKPVEPEKGKIPYYLKLEYLTTSELIDEGFKHNIHPSEFKGMKKAQMIEHIQSKVPRQEGHRLSWTDATPEQLHTAVQTLTRTQAERAVKQQIEQGIYTFKKEEAGIKTYIDEARVTLAIQDVVHGKFRTDNEGIYDANRERTHIVEFLQGRKIKPERFEAILRAKEGEKEFEDSLSPKEWDVVYELQSVTDSGYTVARELGFLDYYIEHYVPHQYKDPIRKVRKVFKEWETDKTRKMSIKEKASWMRKREIPSLKEAMKRGLTPDFDIPSLVYEWHKELGAAASTKKFVQSIKDLPTVAIEGVTKPKRMIEPHYTETYQELVEPGFARMITGDKRARSVWAHPQIYNELQHLYGERWSPPLMGEKFEKSYIKWRDNIKRIIMINPMIHGWNIYSDTFDEVWMSHWSNAFPLWKTSRLVGALPIIPIWSKIPRYGEPARIFFDPTGKKGKAKLKKFRKQWGFDGTTQSLRALMVRSGSNTTLTGDLGVELTDFMGGAMKDLKQGEVPYLTRVKQWSDKFLWGGIVDGAHETVFAIKYGKFIKEGFSSERAGVMASHYSNDLLGTIGREVFLPKEADQLNSLLFARNWTISNLRLISGAFGVTSPNAGFLAHKGLDTKEVRALQMEYAKHLIKGKIGLTITANAIQAMATSTGGFEHAPDKSKITYTWDNPEGHKNDVYLAMKDERDRDIYVVNPLFRYIRDYSSWYEDPRRTLLNKLEPMLKIGMETFNNFKPWDSKPIVEGGAEGIEKLVDWGSSVAFSITPIGQYGGLIGVSRPGEYANWLEAIVPYLGTWVRHGVGGGTPGAMINEYLRRYGPRGYLMAKVDDEIDEMIMSGDITGALDLMKSKERYRSVKGFKDRITKFHDGFDAKWNSGILPDHEKPKFLKWLGRENPQHLQETLDAIKRVGKK
jgi:hypothetical protein